MLRMISSTSSPCSSVCDGRCTCGARIRDPTPLLSSYWTYLGELEGVLLLGQVLHLGVRLPVVQGHGVEVVEGHVQVVRHQRPQVHRPVEETQRPNAQKR